MNLMLPSLAFAANQLALLVPTGKNDPKWFDNPALTREFIPAALDIPVMILFAMVFTVLIDLLPGFLFVQIGKSGPMLNRSIRQLASIVVNVVRSFPSLIDTIVLLPLICLIVGMTLGWQATVVPPMILSVPFLACLVESNTLVADAGKIEAAQMMGASNRQIRWGVQVREATPVLVRSITTLAITLIGYSVTVGALGGGGLGQMAMNYGYNRFQDDVMIVTVLAITVIVQIVQMPGDMISRLVDHR